jgi:hypothetical protein
MDKRCMSLCEEAWLEKFGAGPRHEVMSLFAQAGVPPQDLKDLSPIPDGLRLFARIEGLVGEEAALLAVPPAQRDQAQHDRLRAVSEELDCIWAKLRERAERLGRHGDSPESPA